MAAAYAKTGRRSSALAAGRKFLGESPAKRKPSKGKATNSAKVATAKAPRFGKKTAPKVDIESLDLTKMSKAELVVFGIANGMAFTPDLDETAIRRKVGKALLGITPEIEEQLARIAPTETVDCIGLWIDLASASCVACTLTQDCKDRFHKHAMEGFKAFTAALRAIERPTGVPEPEPVAEREVYAKAPPMKRRTRKRVKYNKERKLSIYDVQNPEKAGSAEFDLVAEIQEEVPEDMGELEQIIFNHFDAETDTDDARKQLVVELATELDRVGILSVL
jgi:hypothetical protein